MESYNDQLRKKIQEGKQTDFREKVYSVKPERTVDSPQLAFRKQFRNILDPRRRRPPLVPGDGEDEECYDGAPGQDGAQISCDGECHAYFA